MDKIQEQFKKILIVDDDQEIVGEIKEILARLPDVSIEVAHNGKEAIDKMKEGGVRYDFVILEVLVPKLNGADVCAEMAKDPSLKTIPVLLTSILPLRSEAFQESLKKYAIFSVVKDTLEKPITNEALLEKVTRLLYKK